jgi:anti-sigma factor RsiW
MTEKPASIDRETLVAYVDNELPPARAAEVERALANDPEAQELVRLMRLGGSAAAHAFDQALEEPPPAHLLVALHGHGKAQSSSGTRRAPGLKWQLALAACIACVAIGFAGGLLERSADKGYAPAAAKSDDPLSADFESTLFVALGSGVPGHSYDYGSDATGHGQLVLGREFVSGFGSQCHEFDRQETRGSVRSHDNGIACQAASGGWTVMIVPR